jgi:small subunit ribosomal protein S6e
MARFKLIISSEDGRAETVDLEGARAQPLVGRKIGETIEGSIAGLEGTKLVITGGSDKDGFPLRKDVHGGARKAIILSRGPGFHPAQKGERRRKSIRGNTITDNVIQINCKAVKEEKGRKKRKPKKAESKTS